MGKYDALAIINRNAANLYNLEIIEKIPTENNYTRFLLISNEDLKVLNEEKNRTIIIFTLENKPGSLYNFLEYFARRNINLSKIESIPLRNGNWEYIFILEYEGNKNSIDLKELKGNILYIEDYFLKT